MQSMEHFTAKDASLRQNENNEISYSVSITIHVGVKTGRIFPAHPTDHINMGQIRVKIRVPEFLHGFRIQIRVFPVGYEIGFGRAVSDGYGLSG